MIAPSYSFVRQNFKD